MSSDEELIELVRRIEISVRCLCKKVMTPVALGERMADPRLNKQEAMHYLGITESTYYRWINEKKLRPHGRSGQHHYYESELREIIDRRRYRERL